MNLIIFIFYKTLSDKVFKYKLDVDIWRVSQYFV